MLSNVFGIFGVLCNFSCFFVKSVKNQYLNITVDQKTLTFVDKSEDVYFDVYLVMLPPLPASAPYCSSYIICRICSMPDVYFFLLYSHFTPLRYIPGIPDKKRAVSYSAFHPETIDFLFNIYYDYSKSAMKGRYYDC